MRRFEPRGGVSGEAQRRIDELDRSEHVRAAAIRQFGQANASALARGRRFLLLRA